MSGILWVDEPYAVLVFLLLTIVIGGAGAFATGRAMAQTWRPLALLIPYMLVLSAGVQFLHFALYQEPLLSIHYFLVAFVWTLIIAGLGYRSMRARQMATQYSWLFERAGLNWKARAGA